MNTTALDLPASILTKKQTRVFGWKEYTDQYGARCRIKATARYDDQCGNGHNSFSITGETQEWRLVAWCEAGGGCIHEEITQHFPELAPLIKWHLCASDGPLHYVANTVYHAGDDGKGKPRRDRQGNPMWQLDHVTYGQDLVCQTEKPADVVLSYQPVLREGKEINLAHARASAIWPEATDEQLLAGPEELTAALLARLPAMMREFKAAVESLGLVY